MKSIKNFSLSIVLLLALSASQSFAQNLVINTALLDGVEIQKENVFSYQIISNLKHAIESKVSGTISFKGVEHRLSYIFNMRLQPGMNTIDMTSIHPQWTYSTNAVRELFVNYNTLPAGTYQYCIEVMPKNIAGEVDLGNVTKECIYHKNQEQFLINLVTPENYAKLSERNPVLTWVANYTFSNELTYSIRVAEIKKGQNTANAIARNNPIFQQKGLMQNSLLYPAFAKELESYQPYAWTVDAYYKGILLGGAEPWKFMIIEDSLPITIPKVISYLDVMNESGKNTVFALGKLKIKYSLENLSSEPLEMILLHQEKALKTFTLQANRGVNKFDLLFPEMVTMKHRKKYKLIIKNTQGNSYEVAFIYLNPDLL